MKSKFVVITRNNLIYETTKLSYLRYGVYLYVNKDSLDNEGRIIGKVKNVFIPYVNIKTIEEIEKN